MTLSKSCDLLRVPWSGQGGLEKLLISPEPEKKFASDMIRLQVFLLPHQLTDVFLLRQHYFSQGYTWSFAIFWKLKGVFLTFLLWRYRLLHSHPSIKHNYFWNPHFLVPLKLIRNIHAYLIYIKQHRVFLLSSNIVIRPVIFCQPFIFCFLFFIF